MNCESGTPCPGGGGGSLTRIPPGQGFWVDLLTLLLRIIVACADIKYARQDNLAVFYHAFSVMKFHGLIKKYELPLPSLPRASLLRDVSRRPACPPLAHAPRLIYLHRDALLPQRRLNLNPTNRNINQGLSDFGGLSELGRPRRELQVFA